MEKKPDRVQGQFLAGLGSLPKLVSNQSRRTTEQLWSQLNYFTTTTGTNACWATCPATVASDKPTALGNQR